MTSADAFFFSPHVFNEEFVELGVNNPWIQSTLTANPMPVSYESHGYISQLENVAGLKARKKSRGQGEPLATSATVSSQHEKQFKELRYSVSTLVGGRHT